MNICYVQVVINPALRPQNLHPAALSNHSLTADTFC